MCVRARSADRDGRKSHDIGGCGLMGLGEKIASHNEIVHRTIGGAIRNFDLLDANSITFDVPLNLSFQHSFFFFHKRGV